MSHTCHRISDKLDILQWKDTDGSDAFRIEGSLDPITYDELVELSDSLMLLIDMLLIERIKTLRT